MCFAIRSLGVKLVVLASSFIGIDEGHERGEACVRRTDVVDMPHFRVVRKRKCMLSLIDRHGIYILTELSAFWWIAEVSHN